MITIRMTDNSLTIKGHARADEGAKYAKVCGAATMLAYLFAAAVDEAAEDGEAMWQTRRVEPGDVELAYDGAVPGLWLLKPGAALLARDYPQFVEVL